ncbi:MAG: hypothetical protein AAF682_25835 [Planctomycetota bacterium]
MNHPTSSLVALLAAAALGSHAAAQVSSNDAPLNNGGDVLFLYPLPSIGATPGGPPDINGDLFWRAHAGVDFMANIDASGAAAMEIDGYHEALWDTDWTTPPDFYTRTHGPALPDAGGLGGLVPAFFQQGLTSEAIVVLGSSGFGAPCTIAPSLCSPPGGSCPPPGFINGYAIDLSFGSTVGSGITLPADGTAASDMATAYFIPGGMTTMGGTCGLGDYTFQDAHSTDESAADATGNGINPFAGFQFGGSGPLFDGINSMVEMTETWRGPVLNVVADTGAGLGVERSDNGGGGMNGRLLDMSSDAATIGVELRDFAGTGIPGNLAVVGASLTPLPMPGVPFLGANLLLLPDGVLNASTSVWQGTVSPTVFFFTSEGAFEGLQAPLAAAHSGTDVYLQGLVLDLGGGAARSTNRVRTRLF